MIDLHKIPFVIIRNPSTDEEIEKVELKLGRMFPEKYSQFLKQTDGFDSDEVRLYSVKEIQERNRNYEVDRYCPDFINIGDDGGGSAILVKDASFKDGKVYQVDHGAMTPEFMEVIGSDFIEWLESGCPLEEGTTRD